MQDKKLINLIVRAAEEKKALDIKVLDIRKGSGISDFMIICSAESEPQLRAIEREIEKDLRYNKVKGFRWQGELKSGWLVLDLSFVVVHVMHQRERDYYQLEELWEKDAIIYHY